MNIALTLCNCEHDFVALGLISMDCRYEYPEIRQIFSDKILEYNWQEDQSDLTAIYILRDAIVELSDGLFDYNNVKLLKDNQAKEIQEKPMNFIMNNVIKGASRDDETDVNLFNIITFQEEDVCFAEAADVFITMAKEDGEEVR